MDVPALLLAAFLVAAALGLGWFLGSRQAASFRKERDERLDDFRKAITDLADVQTKLDDARRESNAPSSLPARKNGSAPSRLD
jgi:hypothetical protein